MNTTREHRWSITAIGATTAHRHGVATGLTATWTAALTAARAALLAGEPDTLAVSIDGELEAMHTPGPSADGNLDPQALTAALVEIHQCVTAHQLAEQLAGGQIGRAAAVSMRSEVRVVIRQGRSPRGDGARRPVRAARSR